MSREKSKHKVGHMELLSAMQLIKKVKVGFHLLLWSSCLAAFSVKGANFLGICLSIFKSLRVNWSKKLLTIWWCCIYVQKELHVLRCCFLLCSNISDDVCVA